MAKLNLRVRLLRSIARRLRSWADAYLNDLEVKDRSTETDKPSNEPFSEEQGPPADFLRRFKTGPPEDWLNRVKAARPDLKDEGQFLLPLQQATDQIDEEHTQPHQTRKSTTNSGGQSRRPKPLPLQAQREALTNRGEVVSKLEIKSESEVSESSGLLEGQIAARESIIDSPTMQKEKGPATVPRQVAGQLENSSQTPQTPTAQIFEKTHPVLKRPVASESIVGIEEPGTKVNVGDGRGTLEFDSRSPAPLAPEGGIPQPNTSDERPQKTRSRETPALSLPVTNRNRARSHPVSHVRAARTDQLIQPTREQRAQIQSASERSKIELSRSAASPAPQSTRHGVPPVTAAFDARVVKTRSVDVLDQRWPDLLENMNDDHFDEFLNAIREIEHIRRLELEQKGSTWSE